LRGYTAADSTQVIGILTDFMTDSSHIEKHPKTDIQGGHDEGQKANMAY
jgi:hypothetical protein